MSLRVETHIAGSHCVVWKDREHYMECRRHDETTTLIECVWQGQVYRRKVIGNTWAPEMIIQIAKEELL